MYAVVVTFEIKDGKKDVFLPAMAQNAHVSLALEAGCYRFDVWTDPDRPAEVFLYELYTDRAAFDAHLQSAHFKAFDAHVASLIASKEVRTYAQTMS